MRSFFLLPVVLIFLSCSDNSSTKIDAQQEIKVETPAPTPKVVQETSVKKTVNTKTAPVNGHSIYAHKCASCHGQNGEKVALNSSKVIAGWSSVKTIEVLKAYQNGTYGKKLKGIMKAQAKALNDTQIKAVSEYISTL